MNNNIVSPTDLQLNDETVVQIKRVSKATTGGRRMRFRAIVVVGDSQGHLGIGFGRANEVASAVDKAKNTAKKKVVSEDSKAKEISNKFAIIETGGKQYKVAKDTIIDVEKLNVEPNQTIQFDTVLLLSDQTKLNIGTPYIEGAKVKAKVLEHIKAKKEVVFKFKRKTGYKKTQGHRQKLTRLHIQSI